jgi:hypothetical protein
MQISHLGGVGSNLSYLKVKTSDELRKIIIEAAYEELLIACYYLAASVNAKELPFALSFIQSTISTLFIIFIQT